MKNFDEWNRVKKLYSKKQTMNNRVYFKEREIWWLSLGLNIGDEEDGKGLFFERPVLILRKFNNNLFWACALSSKLKENPYYFKSFINNEYQSVIISQLRMVDSKRLNEKIGMLNKDDFLKIKTAIKRLL